ncbi:hypothetical protein [uncultured Brachyspira sp.]|uniref:hypothetical protein n=1 Tax=uncultured Brachyspira sp. TaxID=221953 RepID=UPI0026232A53|nr:hypothetical protein [uncultured Brachyspira sp.]
MNKKILTLFLVVAASAILAVSCNNKTTDPVKNTGGSTTTTTTPSGQEPATTPTDGKEEAKKTSVTKDSLEKAVQTLGDVILTTKENAKEGKFSFTSAKFSGSELKITVKGSSNKKDPSGTDKFERTTAASAIKAAFKTEELKTLGLKIDKVEPAKENNDNKKAVIEATLLLDDNSKYEFDSSAKDGKIIIELDVTDGIGAAVTFE